MKICPQCNTPQKDANTRCIECGAPLGKPVSKAEQARYDAALSDSIDDAANRAEDFYVTPFDRVLCVMDALGIVFSIVLILLLPEPRDDRLAFCALLLFVFALIDTAFPKLLWSLEKWKHALTFDADNMEPSPYYLVMRKVMNVVFPVIAAFLLAFLLINANARDERQYDPSNVVNITDTGAVIWAVGADDTTE